MHAHVSVEYYFLRMRKKKFHGKIYIQPTLRTSIYLGISLTLDLIDPGNIWSWCFCSLTVPAPGCNILMIAFVALFSALFLLPLSLHFSLLQVAICFAWLVGLPKLCEEIVLFIFLCSAGSLLVFSYLNYKIILTFQNKRGNKKRKENPLLLLTRLILKIDIAVNDNDVEKARKHLSYPNEGPIFVPCLQFWLNPMQNK